MSETITAAAEADGSDTAGTPAEINADAAAPDTGVDVPAEGADLPETGSADRRLSDEAARWRVTARQAETKLVVAEARLEQMRVAEVQRLAANKLADPADLFLGGITIDRLLGEDGEVDPQLVDEAAEAVLEQKPHWRSRPRPVGAPASAVNSDGKITGGTPTPTWADLLGKGNNAG